MHPVILNRWKLDLPRTLTLKVPLLSDGLRKAIQRECGRIFSRSPWPAPLRLYLESAVEVLPLRTPTVAQVLTSPKIVCPTPHIFEVVEKSQCECHRLATENPSIFPVSRGHFFLREFKDKEQPISTPALTPQLPDPRRTKLHEDTPSSPIPTFSPANVTPPTLVITTDTGYGTVA